MPSELPTHETGDSFGSEKDQLFHDATQPDLQTEPTMTMGEDPMLARQRSDGDGGQGGGDGGCCGKVLGTLQNLVPPGSMPATVFSTAATAMGGGILGLPSAFLSSGAVAGFIWVTLIGAETAYSLRLLALTSELTGEVSYERMASVLLGRGGTYLVSAMRFLNCFGSMIAYVMSIGNLLSPIIKGAEAPSFWQEGHTGFRVLQALFWLVFFFPLVIPREVNALRYVSTAGVLFMVFFCICVVAHFAQNGPSSDLTMFRGGNDAMNGIGVFMFSYICQVNQVELYREMRNRTVARFTISAMMSCTILCVLYGLTGLFGYLEFGNTIEDSILKMYRPLKEPQFLVAFIGVFVKLCASYGLFGNVCINAIYLTIGWEPKRVSMLVHILFVAVLTLITLMLGLFWPQVEIVFNFVGGICGGSLGFILPTLFYMYAGNFTLQKVGVFNYFVSYLVLCAGAAAVVIGTATSIYSAVS